MSPLARISLFCTIGFLAGSQMACNMVPQHHMQQSVLRARQLVQHNRTLAQERDGWNHSTQALASEKQRLQSDLDLATKRLSNLQAERSTMQERYASLLRNAQNQPSPLSRDVTRQFEVWAEKYGIEFDPRTGVSQFRSEILFSSGSDQVKPGALEALRDFANLMNQEDAKRLKVAIVGHTDDKPIRKAHTRAKHPTNWHLSTDRATAVLLALAKAGIHESRMSPRGHGEFLPAIPNRDAKSRRQNRRVEIFVLAPDAVVAGWDPGTSRN